MEKLAVLCPVAESVDPVVFQHTMAMISFASQNGVEIKQVGVTKRTLIHSARNALAKGFLSTDCEWAFWMDSDMLLPANAINRLLEVSKSKNSKFVTGIYYQRLGEHLPVLWRKDPVSEDGIQLISDPKNNDKHEAYRHHYVVPSKDSKEPFKADVCGFGCVLMHRELLEKIPYPYFKTISDECSEDFYFCVQARKFGFELWADPLMVLGHIGDPVIITKNQCMLTQDKLRKIKV